MGSFVPTSKFGTQLSCEPTTIRKKGTTLRQESLYELFRLEQELRKDLHQFLLSMKEVDERMPECPDVEEKWEEIAKAYVPDEMTMSRIIREAQPSDMADIMTVMDAAKKIMRQSGNMHQWSDGYPSEAVITADIERNGGFVIEDDGKVVGYFAFLPSPEPTYARIYDGEWLDDTQPYHVVHRIASYPDAHDIFSSIMEFGFSHDTNIRIDTHRDNEIMQYNILKHGFTYCGIIYLLSGDERLVYQKMISR